MDCLNRRVIFAILSAVRFKGKIEDSIWLFIGLALIAGALFLFTPLEKYFLTGFIGRHEFSSGVSAAPISAALGDAAIPNQTAPVVRIGVTEIPVELATSSSAVHKGLSGRSLLGADQGMLFIFDRPDRYRFWMPDMHFPIDIIWIDGGKIVDADENVSPEFDPSRPVFYTSAHPVRYVLEVNAGFMKRNNMRIGDPVTFHRIR